MIVSDIAFPNFLRTVNKQLRVYLDGPNVAEMASISQYALLSVKERVLRGVGSDDLPLPALSAAYAKQKQRAGQPPVRNMVLTGEMLTAMSVRSVSSTEGRIDITSDRARAKAIANERRSPWEKFSPDDVRAIAAYAKEEFRQSDDWANGYGQGTSARLAFAA